jgi:hypothetical protein
MSGIQKELIEALEFPLRLKGFLIPPPKPEEYSIDYYHRISHRLNDLMFALSQQAYKNHALIEVVKNAK